MEMKIEGVAKTPKLKLGDIVVYGGTDPYIAMKQDNGRYILRSFNGIKGAVGSHDSMDELSKALNRHHDAVIYPSSDYELVLKKKVKPVASSVDVF